MRITNEDCYFPTFRVLECLFEGRCVLVDFNKFEINVNTKVVRIKTMGPNSEMLKFSSLKPCSDEESEKSYFIFLKKEYDKIISDSLVKAKRDEKKNTKIRTGQLVY